MSSEAFLGTVGHANYGAAKGGIVSFARSVAREMGRYNVTCNAIAPEAGTRFTLAPDVVEGIKKRYEAGLITKERLDELLNIPRPEAVAPMVVYLSTEEASNINGQIIRVAGGEVSLYSESVRAKSIFKNFAKDGPWTLDELSALIPKTIALGLVNPAPPEKENK